MKRGRKEEREEGGRGGREEGRQAGKPPLRGSSAFLLF